METIQAQLHSCQKESMKTGIQEEVLMMKSNVAGQVKELSSYSISTRPITGADIVYHDVASNNTTVVCQNYGQVYTPLEFAEGNGLEDALVRKESNAVCCAS